MSTLSEMTKRVRAKPEKMGPDYKLADERFNLYVPASPGVDERYGLMVGIPFADGHGFAPELWRPVLDEFHVIWICAGDAGDNHAPGERIGKALDAEFNARKIWPIDESRIYLSSNTRSNITGGVGLHYPDIFKGVLTAGQFSWYEDVVDKEMNRMLSANIARPSDTFLALARTRPFFFADKDSGKTHWENRLDELFARRCQQSGFKLSKLAFVPPAEMDHWTDWSGTWFRQGIEFLDAAPRTAAGAKPRAVDSLTTKPARAATRPAAPAAADAATDKAAAALSLAKSYYAAQKYDLAIPRLQKIVETYPGTPVAKEAKALLAEIQKKQ